MGIVLTEGQGTPRNPCLDPIVMINGGGQYTFGDGYTWCGPYSEGFGFGNTTTSLASSGSSRWMQVTNTIQQEHARIEITEGSPPVDRANATWVQLPTNPPTSGNDASQVVYDKTLDRWIVCYSGGGECATTDDYAESWTLQASTAGLGGGGNTNVAVTESGTTNIYHVNGQSTFLTTNGGVSWSSTTFGLPTFSARSLSYNPFTDEMWVSISNGGVYTCSRASFLGGSGVWSIQLGVGSGNEPRVDINTFTGTAIVTWRASGEWRSLRKPLGATSFQDNVLIATTSAGQGDLIYSSTINRIYAGCGNNLIRFSNDDGQSWQVDSGLTLPSTSGGFRIQNKERFTVHDF